MSDLIGFLEDLDPKVWPWADVLILIGLCGGLVFAVWIVGGAIADVFKVLLVRPNRQLGAHAATTNDRWGVMLAAAGVIGGSLGAIIWVITQ